MTLEVVKTSELTNADSLRIEESQKIRYLGQVAAASAALRLLHCATSLEEALHTKTQIEELFDNSASCRKDLIRVLDNEEQICRSMNEVLNPAYKESNLAFQLRRLTLIGKVAKNQIAEGEIAVQAVDLFLGCVGFNLNSMDLVKNRKKQ